MLPAARGRILARDGTVLACDETIRAVAVEYRWLQDPPDERWLRNMARMRLPKADRKNAEKLAAEKAKRVGRAGGTDAAFGQTVRPFGRAMGRADAEDPDPRRTHFRRDQPPPEVGRCAAGDRPTTRGLPASAGCCWTTRRRRE